MIERLRELSIVVGASFRISPMASIVIVILTITQALAMPVVVVTAGLFIDAAASGDEPRTIALGCVLAAAVGARWVLGNIATHITVRMQREVARDLDSRLIIFDSRLAGLAHHEQSGYLAQLELLRDEHWRLGFALSATVDSLALVVQFVASVLVLFRLQPALVVLPLCGVPSLLATARAKRLANTADEAMVERVRREKHIFELGTSATAAKEIRVFGLADEMMRLHRMETDAVLEARHSAQRAGAFAQAVASLVFVAGYVGAIILVVAHTVGGEGTAGDVLVVVGLTGQIWGLFGRSLETLTWMLSVLRVVARIRWLEHYAQQQARPLEQSAPVPSQLHHGIDLVGVSFHYPGVVTAALEDVNLYLPAGATIAIVGDNGAGKSTLIKLLCRFYEPTNGCILVDGTDLARFDVRSWRQQLAGAFQDYVRFAFIARETVGVGDLPALETGVDTPILTALARAGTMDVLEALPQGLDTRLGLGYEGAVDISGGQWQKLALARARMRTYPLLLMLDEPTAALDPQAEHDLFERFAGAAQEVHQHGGITLLISHRFSTVRMANLIVVIADRRVKEVGTHEQLMALNGLYAELYTLQARAYTS